MILNTQLITLGLLASSAVSPLKANENTIESMPKEDKTVYHLPLNEKGQLDKNKLRDELRFLDRNLSVLQDFSKSVEKNGWSDEAFSQFVNKLKLENPESKAKIQAAKPYFKEAMTNRAIQEKINSGYAESKKRLYTAAGVLIMALGAFMPVLAKREDTQAVATMSLMLVGLSGTVLSVSVPSIEDKIVNSQKVVCQCQSVAQQTTQQHAR